MDPRLQKHFLPGDEQVQQINERIEHSAKLQAKKITDDLDLPNKIQVLATKPAYATLKDQKENFCRLQSYSWTNATNYIML